MRKTKILIFIVLLMFFGQVLHAITPKELSQIDLNKDYKNLKISELRLIRSMVLARHGYLFMETELRNYFTSNFKWYDSIIWHNGEKGLYEKGIPPVTLSDQEQRFVDKIDNLIGEKSKQNYNIKDSLRLPEIDNIFNWFSDKEISTGLRSVLANNGFAVEKAKHEQLFHLYDQNRYTSTPSFVTTDLFLQLFHVYFSYILKDLEKEKLSGLITDLSEALYNESMKYMNSQNPQVVKMANFNTCFFAVAYTLISGKKLKVPMSVVGLYENELIKIDNGRDYISLLFNKSFVPYSLIVPRGYYTRTEEQKRYFRATMWLQIAPFCLSDNELLKNACFNAFLLEYGKDPSNRSLKEMYNAVYEPIAFLIGDADNLSVRDICNIYEKYKINKVEFLAEPKMIDIVATKLKAIEESQDKIQPKIKPSCFPKINFMPQRYLMDNDILQQFADTTRGAEKAFPKGLEVFAVLGCDEAKNLLYNYYHENKKWKDYDSVMNQQLEKFSDFTGWNNTVYNKWLQSLVRLNQRNKSYPSFMQTPGWQLKNLNTSLASWAELKHDVILYGEQPMTAEMGAGGDDIPPPVMVGYVEPNIEFWNSCKALMAKNEMFLAKYNLKTEELNYKTKSVSKLLGFFSKVSQKELNNQSLTSDEYDEIENIGGEFDYLSLSMVNPYINFNGWEEVTGPDKTVALIADVYTRNVPDCPKNAILHEASGFGNTIYVVVEINGHLYLTRGATFSYYEFPVKERLTDEKWLEMLNQNSVDPVDWMNEITVQ